MKKILKLLLPILILGIGFGGFKYMQATKSKETPIKIEEQTWVVAVKPVTLSVLSPTITLYGRVESPRTATLRTPTLSLNISTKVIKVAILEGEKVKKGQILIALENKDSHLNLKQKEAEVMDINAQIQLEKQHHESNLNAIKHEQALLKLMQTSVKRLSKLKKKKLSSEAASDEAQQAVERQMLIVINRRLEIKNHKSRHNQLKAKRLRIIAQRDIADLELARTQIKAPFTGVISKVTVAIGDTVRSGDSLLSIYDNSALEIRAQIPSRYQNTVLKALTKGYHLQARTQIQANKYLRLQLDRVSGKINLDSGGIDGLFRAKNKVKLLRLGEFITLQLSLPNQSRIIALPFEAVYGINRVYKLVNGRMKTVNIERIGEQSTTKGYSEILVRSHDLHQNDQVIITQLPNAMDGLKVRVSQDGI
jgi:RND family efflux transporter MFP subunit